MIIRTPMTVWLQPSSDLTSTSDAVYSYRARAGSTIVSTSWDVPWYLCRGAWLYMEFGRWSSGFATLKTWFRVDQFRLLYTFVGENCVKESWRFSRHLCPQNTIDFASLTLTLGQTWSPMNLNPIILAHKMLRHGRILSSISTDSDRIENSQRRMVSMLSILKRLRPFHWMLHAGDP